MLPSPSSDTTNANDEGGMGKEEEEVCLRALQEGRAVYGEWKAQLYPDFNKVGVFRCQG